MGQLIGIVIPPDVKSELIDFCKRYRYTLVDPHITLIKPEMLEGVSSFDRKLQSFCLSQPPFNTIIGGPNIDVNKSIYLMVLPGLLNGTRERLIKHLKRKATGELYRPHISLVVNRPGNEYNLEEILPEAKKVFSKPRSIGVDSLGLYSQATPESPYVLEKTYPFTGR